MSWQKERDALIAQTMAFVQSVTGKREETSHLNGRFAAAPVAELPDLPEPASPQLELSPKPAARLVAPIEPARIMEVSPAVAALTPRPIAPSDMASEIRARVATFRAHQERFNREREQYFSATLDRLRASIKDMPAPPRFDE
ncbi:MAG: hypothetical protein JO141_32610 [Bradyrhizobium sp.]|nr:hypothetical protein [Bradyrhizobium sp.]